jgi:hypothetical protein
MKANESAVLEGCEALQLYVSRLTAALGELAVQAQLLHDETNVLADAVADSSYNHVAVMLRPEQGI